MHVPNIAGPFVEFVRVLRPGGHLVVSDQRGLIGDIGLPLVNVDPHGELGYIPVYPRLASEYLAAALPLGFRVLRCEEPRVPSPLLDEEGRTVGDGERLPPQDPGRRAVDLGAYTPRRSTRPTRRGGEAVVDHLALSAPTGLDGVLYGQFMRILIIGAVVLFLVLWVRATLDVFRRGDLNSSAKAAWAIIMLVFPFDGLLVYMMLRPSDAQIAQRTPR